MSRKSAWSLYISIAASLLTFVWVLPNALAQHGSEGTVAVTVLDPSGSVVQGAELELTDLATNAVRKVQTHESGTYTFVNLSLGKYKLTVGKSPFKTQVDDAVLVEAG